MGDRQSVIIPQRAYQFFKQNFVLTRPSPQKWYSFDCTFCGKHNKMAVHFIRSQVKCWSCGANGSIVDFVMDAFHVDNYEAKQLIHSVKATSLQLDLLEEIENSKEKKSTIGGLPHGFNELMQGDGIMGKRARNYLSLRGFDCEQLDRMGFGYVNTHYPNHDTDREAALKDYYGYIIIPYKRRCRLQYYIGRDYIGNFLRYKNPSTDVFGIGKGDIIYNEDALGLYDTVFALEGALDAITMGKQATATSGWQLSPYQQEKYLSSKVKRLVLIPDIGVDNTGESFYRKAVKLATVFLDTSIQVYVVDLDVPELNTLGKDANEIGKKNVLRKYKEDTAPLTWSSAMDILTQEYGKKTIV